jgi:hypothetical protein
MRSALATILMIGLAAVAAAQPVRPVPASGSFPPLPPIGLPLPQIGLPLPQIGLPLPQIGLPVPATDVPRAMIPGRNNARINRPVPGSRRQRPSVVFVVPTFGVPVYDRPITNEKTWTNGSTTSAPPQGSPFGQLQLDIDSTGDQQQLYVDGNYVGTFKDFRGGMDLDAGPHTIDIQAPGYETLRLDVNVSAGRTIAYHGTLTPTSPANRDPAVPSAPAAPTTIYVIPGCYIGNVPPQQVDLPASCDVSRVVTTQR